MKQINVTLLDDISGEPGAETVSFAYGGQSYTIDLGDKNRAAFDKAMAMYIESATPKNGASLGVSTAEASARKAHLDAVREWASGAGFEVAPRGRIRQEVIDAYHVAQQPPPAPSPAAVAKRTRARVK